MDGDLFCQRLKTTIKVWTISLYTSNLIARMRKSPKFKSFTDNLFSNLTYSRVFSSDTQESMVFSVKLSMTSNLLWSTIILHTKQDFIAHGIYTFLTFMATMWKRAAWRFCMHISPQKYKPGMVWQKSHYSLNVADQLLSSASLPDSYIRINQSRSMPNASINAG